MIDDVCRIAGELDKAAPGAKHYDAPFAPGVFSTQSWKARLFWLAVAGAIALAVAAGIVAGGAAW